MSEAGMSERTSEMKEGEMIGNLKLTTDSVMAQKDKLSDSLRVAKKKEDHRIDEPIESLSLAKDGRDVQESEMYDNLSMQKICEKDGGLEEETMRVAWLSEAGVIGLSGEMSEGYEGSLLQNVAQMEVLMTREIGLRDVAECGEREGNLRKPMSEYNLRQEI